MGSFVLRSIGWFQTRRVGSEMEMSAWVSKLEAAPLKFVKNRKKFTNIYFSGNSLSPGCRDKAALSRSCHCDGAGVLSPQGLLHKYVMGQKENPCRLSGRTTVAWTGCIDTKVFHNQLRFNFEQSKMILPWGQKNCGKRQRSANLWKRKPWITNNLIKNLIEDWKIYWSHR